MILPTKHTTLLIFIVFSSFVNAQDVGVQISIESPNYSVFNWTTEQGLPQNAVLDIVEDDNGFIWVATLDGIARFDGYEFTIFNKNSIEGMTSSEALSVCEDGEGNIWFTTFKEIIRFSNNTFTRFSLPKNQAFNLHTNLGKVYLYSKLSIYTIVNDQFILLRSSTPSTDLISGIVSIDDKLVFIQGGQLFWLEDGSPYCAGKFLKSGNLCVQSFSDNDFYELTKTGPRLLKDKRITDDNSPATVYSFEDKSTLVVRNGIIKVYDSNRQELLKTSLSQLSIGSIHSIRKSKDGIIWIGSSSKGLYMLYPKRFKTISSLHPSISSTGYFVYQAKDSTIWMNGPCEVIYSTPDEGKTIYRHEQIGCSWSMVIDHLGQQWSLGINEGLKRGKEFFLEYNDTALTKRYYSIYETFDKRLMVGTELGVYEITADRSTRILNSNSLGKVYSFYENRNNELIFCASKGVGKIIGKKAVKLDILNQELDVRSVYQDVELNYWIGTANDGLFWYNGKQTKALKTKIQSLPKDVWAILEDKNGFFWLNSNNGIYRVKRNDLIDYGKGEIFDLNTIRFGTIDGLVNSEGNSRTQNKGFEDFKGKFWFSTIAGPAFIDPLSINTSSFSNPIILESISIDGKVVNPSSIVIGPDEDNIQFKFTQANFLDTRHLGYEYSLSGSEDNWISLKNSRLINLSALPEGNYTLRIRQAGTEIETAIDFEVQGYFYESNLFKIGMSVLGTMFVLYILFVFYKRRRRASRKMHSMDEQLKTLKIRALQSQMNPHFIFNCLNSIQSLYLIGERDKANIYMTNFSKLLRMILMHAESKTVSLDQEIKMYNAYIPLESLQLNDSFTYSINVDPSIDPSTTHIPSMVSQTFVENAIKHGLSPLKDHKGELKIEISQTNDEIVILIEDNGVGLRTSLELKKEIKGDHESRGTAITQERIELMNSLNDLNIRVEIKDSSDDKGKTGTIVQLFFPKNISNENSNN